MAGGFVLGCEGVGCLHLDFAHVELPGEQLPGWETAFILLCASGGLIDARLSALGVLVSVSSETLREVLALVLVLTERCVSVAGLDVGHHGSSSRFTAWSHVTGKGLQRIKAIGSRPSLLCLGSRDLFSHNIAIFFLQVDHE